MRKRLIFAVVAPAVLSLALAACGHTGAGGSGATQGARQGGTTAAAGSGKESICLVMKSLANQYYSYMEKGAVAHAKQVGVTLQASGIQNETDVDAQVALVQKCIAQKVKAIVIAPADAKALVQSAAQAVKAGIRVVNIDTALDPAALKQAGANVPFVGPDNAAASKASGMVLAKDLGPGAKVVILEGNPGAANADGRKHGFQEAVANGKLHLLASRTAHWETDEAYTVFSNLLTAHPDIQGVLSSNDDMSLGVIKVIQQRHAKIKVASFDNIAAVQPYFASNILVSTVDQYAGKQAADGIDVAMKMVGGQTITGWQKTKWSVLTKANSLGS
jgi:ribose transport system substrate-binding protein